MRLTSEFGLTDSCALWRRIGYLQTCYLYACAAIIQKSSPTVGQSKSCQGDTNGGGDGAGLLAAAKQKLATDQKRPLPGAGSDESEEPAAGLLPGRRRR